MVRLPALSRSPARLLCVAWLLWQGGRAGLAQLSSIAHTGFGDLTASSEARVEAALDPQEFAVWSLLRAQTPEDATVLFVMRDSRAARASHARLAALLHPRQLVPLPCSSTPPVSVPEGTTPSVEQLYVLLYGELSRHILAAPAERRVPGPQAALWFWRRTPSDG